MPRGLQFGRHRTFDGIDHEYAFVIPKDYDPSRPYQVRFQLHGGIARARPPVVNRIRVDALPSGVEEILGISGRVGAVAVVVGDAGRQPRAHPRSAEAHLQHRREPRLPDGHFRRRHRRVLHGLQGPDAVGELSSADWQHGGARHSSRCGPKARCIPATRSTSRSMSSTPDAIACIRRTWCSCYVDHLRKLGGRVVFRVYPELDHSTEWWPNERPELESFVHDHPREPLPDEISWQTERVDRFNRAHWLIIDRLGSVDGESRLPDTQPAAARARARFRPADQLDRRSRPPRARGRGGLERLSHRPARRRSLRRGERQRLWRPDATSPRRWQRWECRAIACGSWSSARGDRKVLEGVFEPAEVDLPPTPIFPRRKPSGRVDLVRRGNVVEASTEGVRAFTLLLSPSIFDFRRPDHGRRERAHGVRGHGRAERGDDAEMGRARQRPDDGVRGRAENRTGK